MADYVVKFTGQDNLSSTINKVNKELGGLENSSSKLDKIMDKFNRIDQSAAPIKKKLRDLKSIMAQMNLDGLTGTDQFTLIAEKAGALSDAMGDASTAIKQYSNDTFKLQAGIEAFQGIAAAATVATGVMGLLGTENEKVEQAILKVQSAMAIMNGVQQIANTLNKDSALMLRLKSIWTAANTTATGANTVATGANTAATIANTSAQKAWNMTKAIGKALFGDWTGLVLVGAAALGTYALATSNASDAEEEHNEKLKQNQATIDSYTSTLTTTFAQLMTSYSKLRAEWKNLSSEQQKNQWIKDNQSKLEELNISVNNVADAESVFKNNTPSVVKAFEARAKAAAQLALLTENYKKQMELIDKINATQASMTADAASRQKVKAGQEIKDESQKSSRYGSVNGAGKWVYSEAGAKLNNTGISNTNPVLNSMNDELKGLQDKANEIANNISQTYADIPSFTKADKTTNTTKTGKTKTTKVEIAPEGSLQALEDELNKLNKELKLTPETDTTKIEELKGKIAELTGKKEALEIKLGIKEPKKEEAKKWAEGSIASIKEEIAKLDDRLLNENLQLPVRLKLIAERNDLQKQVDKLSNGDKSTYELYGEYSKQAGEITNQRNIGLISADDAKSQIAEINQELQKLGIDPIKVHIETDSEKAFKGFKDDADSILGGFEGIDSVVNSFESLSKSIADGANAWEIFMGAVNVASSVLNAISTIMETVNLLSSIHTATKATESAATIAAATAQGVKAGADAASIAPTIASTVALKAQEAAYLNLAAAAYFAAHAPIPFAGFGIAAGFVSAMMGAMAVQAAASQAIAAFADGGVISGNTFHGDKMLARVNAGEMILNQKQQANLFNMLNSGASNAGGTVEFKISGSQLKGVLNNYNSKMNKVK